MPAEKVLAWALASRQVYGLHKCVASVVETLFDVLIGPCWQQQSSL